MLRLAWILGLVLSLHFLAGCGSYVTDDLRTDKPSTGKPAWGMPILIDGSDYLLVPFAMERPRDFMEFDHYYSPRSNSGFWAYKEGYSKFHSFVWHNVAFRHRESNETRLLLDRKAMISRMLIYQNKKPIPYHLFGIHDVDTNGDRFINEHDAERLYYCNLDGTGLSALTPAGTDVSAVRVDHAHGKIFVAVAYDSNLDRRYDRTDRSETFEFNVHAIDQPAMKVVSTTIQEKAEAIYR